MSRRSFHSHTTMSRYVSDHNNRGQGKPEKPQSDGHAPEAQGPTSPQTSNLQVQLHVPLVHEVQGGHGRAQKGGEVLDEVVVRAAVPQGVPWDMPQGTAGHNAHEGPAANRRQVPAHGANELLVQLCQNAFPGLGRRKEGGGVGGGTPVVKGLASGLCLVILGGGGRQIGPPGFWLTHPLTHIRKFFLRKKMKFIKGARTWRSILGTQTFFWPLTHPPPPPGIVSTSH